MGACSTIAFVPATFRGLFPAFATNPPYTDDVLGGYFAQATVYISDNAGGCYCGGLNTAQQTQALYLMTAHIVAINALIAAGQTPYVVTGAGIDKINLTLQPPPAPNQWQWWLNTTPYGQQLLAMLQTARVGGFYVPGKYGPSELSAFRRSGGTW